MECVTPKHGITKFLKWNEMAATDMDLQTSNQWGIFKGLYFTDIENNQTSFSTQWAGTKHGQASLVILKKPVDTSILWASQLMVQRFTSNSCPWRMTSMHSTVFPQHFLTWSLIKQKWLANTCCGYLSSSQRYNLHTTHLGATHMWIIQLLTWDTAIYFISTQLKVLPCWEFAYSIGFHTAILHWPHSTKWRRWKKAKQHKTKCCAEWGRPPQRLCELGVHMPNSNEDMHDLNNRKTSRAMQ